MMRFFHKFALAISYVTCIPVANLNAAIDETMLEGLAKYLPGVGILIGSAAAALSYILNQQHINSLLSAGIVTFTWLWLTGGLHMDGFMDTADGVFSHRSRERMLEIMQDSRVGNFAVLAAISLLALKIFALASLSNIQACAVLLIVPAWARACEVYTIGHFQYARAIGKGKIWHDTTKFPRDLFISIMPVALLTAAAAICLDMRTVQVASAATILGGILTAYWLNSKVGGHTGDTYGAVVEAAETAGLLFAALFV